MTAVDEPGSRAGVGRVVRVIGPVVDAEFPRDAIPAMYNAIINHKRVNDYDLRSIKACISGAAPLPMEVQTRFGEITGGRLREGYGLTEAAPVTHCNPIYGEPRAGSIGLPFPEADRVRLATTVAGRMAAP